MNQGQLSFRETTHARVPRQNWFRTLSPAPVTQQGNNTKSCATLREGFVRVAGISPQSPRSLVPRRIAHEVHVAFKCTYQEKLIFICKCSANELVKTASVQNVRLSDNFEHSLPYPRCTHVQGSSKGRRPDAAAPLQNGLSALLTLDLKHQRDYSSAAVRSYGKTSPRCKRNSRALSKGLIKPLQ